RGGRRSLGPRDPHRAARRRPAADGDRGARCGQAADTGAGVAALVHGRTLPDALHAVGGHRRLHPGRGRRRRRPHCPRADPVRARGSGMRGGGRHRPGRRAAAGRTAAARRADTGRGAGVKTQLRLLRYLWPRWPSLITVLSTMGLGVLVDLARPWPIKILVDNVLGSRPLPSGVDHAVNALPGPGGGDQLLFWVAACTVLIFLAANLLTMVGTYASVGLGERMTYDVGADLFA